VSVGAIWVLLFPRLIGELSARGAEARALGIAAILSTSCEAAIDFDDRAGGDRQLETLDAVGDVDWARLWRSDGRPLAEFRAPEPGRMPAPPPSPRIEHDSSGLTVLAPVRSPSGRSGLLEIRLRLDDLRETGRHVLRRVALVSALVLLLGLAAALLLARLLTVPLRRITRVALRIAAGEEVPGDALPLSRLDELGDLARAFDRMLRRLFQSQTDVTALNAELERRVADRTRQLGDANAELERRLSELHRAQEQLVVADRRTSLGTLAAGVAHEINNPLAFITSNLEFTRDLLRAPGGAELEGEQVRQMAEAVDDALQGAVRVKQIVRGLKTLSRGDDGDRRVPVDVTASLDAALGMAWSEIKHRALLVREQEEELPKVLASEVRLTQVFLNLLINAAQAIGDAAGGPERNQILIRTSTDDAGRAVILIRDTGPGISLEVQSRLFDPFFTTKPVGQGTGLGLSICQGIVTSLGGTIAVESFPGAGAAFTVTLPAAPPAALAEEPPETRAAPLPRARLLVVDDEPLARAALERALGLEHDVEVASDGPGALELLAQGKRYDLILCDLMMPGFSPGEFALEVAVRWPASARALYFLTGGAVTPEAQAFVLKNGARILDKPLEVGRLRELLREGPP
jgi:signal transduction histidine kinase